MRWRCRRAARCRGRAAGFIARCTGRSRVVWRALVFERFARGKFFLQTIVSAADHYYALRTGVRRISFLKATRSWEVRSVGAGGPSSNMDQFCWHDRSGRRSCAGLCDVAAVSDDPKEWSDRLVEWVTTGIGLRPMAGDASRLRFAGSVRARCRAVSRPGMDGNPLDRSARVRVTLFNLRKIKLQ